MIDMKDTKKVKIIIATHKKYWMPSDEIYLPVHVGAEGKKDAEGNELDLGYCKDNSGDNISELNSSFCELTGLYWAWKNVDADFIGLAHYRRHFSMKKRKDVFESVLSGEELEPFLPSVSIFVPQKRKYYIESLYSHYAHTHYKEHLDDTRCVIEKKYPEYLESYDKVVKHTYGYMFNMMICRKDLLEDYCTWLFDILFEIKDMYANGNQKYADISAFQGRFYGRISEIIFNVWLDYQVTSGKIKKSEIKELKYIHMERINWVKKGSAFLKAKLFQKRYEGSF